MMIKQQQQHQHQRTTTMVHHSGIINSINETEANLNKMGLVEMANVVAKEPKSLEKTNSNKNKKKKKSESSIGDRQQLLLLKEEFEQKLMQGASTVVSSKV
jgi:hypothetical protein